MSHSADAPRLRSGFENGAWAFCVDNIKDIIRLGLLPIGIALAASFLASFMSVSPIIGYIANGVAGVIFAGRIHRTIIEGGKREGNTLRVRARDFSYMGLVLLYILAARLFGVLEDMFVWLLGASAEVVLGGLYVWLVLRLMLVFPHVAVTGEISFGLSWWAMRGNIWRLFAIGLRWPPARFRKGFHRYAIANVLFGGLSLATSGQLKLFFFAVAVAQVIVIAAVLLSFIYKDLVASPQGSIAS